MNYQAVVNWLFSQLANYQKQGSKAYKPGLGNINALLKHLSNPHHSFKSIHIAGTNGKGSVAHILTSMAIENGYKVGLFTSPHIKDFRERIKINGLPVEENQVTSFVNANKTFFEDINPSFFEITTAMAFHIFAKEQCDIAIIETGLGGRLDSTNVIDPELSVITNIGLDHTEMLGDTLTQIAGEKAGIIKEKKPVIVGELLKETKDVFIEYAAEKKAPLHQPEIKSFETDLLGVYQQNNISLAWDALQILKNKGWYFDDVKSLNALKRVKKNTGFKGRLDLVEDSPRVIVDAAHNKQGIELLLKEVETIEYERLHCVYGSSSDKDYFENGVLFPKTGQYYFTRFDSDRSVTREKFEAFGKHYELNYTCYESPEHALKSAKERAGKNDLIVVFGSFFILEKII